MSAGTITQLKQLLQEALGVCTDNTNLWIACNDGTVYKVVISGLATTVLKQLFQQKPVAIAQDGTNCFVGCDDGTIYKIVQASGVTTVIARLNLGIISMAYYSNTLYITTVGGGVYSVTTA